MGWGGKFFPFKVDPFQKGTKMTKAVALERASLRLLYETMYRYKASFDDVQRKETVKFFSNFNVIISLCIFHMVIYLHNKDNH